MEGTEDLVVYLDRPGVRLNSPFRKGEAGLYLPGDVSHWVPGASLKTHPRSADALLPLLIEGILR